MKGEPGMNDFFFRTEDIKPEEVIRYFAETKQDRQIIEALKNRNPTILVGSRGVGKSFLLRVAEQELKSNFESARILPVYLSFVRSSLLATNDPEQFKNWMLARICSAVIRAVARMGLTGIVPQSLSAIAGQSVKSMIEETRIETIADQYESSWKDAGSTRVDSSQIPTVDVLKDAVEELCVDLSLERIVLLIDEAAHIFLPEQQRQFFTLFRDLRSHCIVCNAAVYPGVTSYGETFQPAHDATMLSIDRDVQDRDYVKNMREIVEKQADSNVLNSIVRQAGNFSILAYAATGNPRSLLKTVSKADRLSSGQINDVIRQYYRVDIWSEHSNLADKYLGLRSIIDWGRKFVEGQVLPEIKSKNDAYQLQGKNTSAYFWVHRDVTETVRLALRILSYTGIVVEQASGIKATRGEIGQRYLVNLGCLFALESTPGSSALQIAVQLTTRRMTEYGHSHPKFKELNDLSDIADLIADSTPLRTQLMRSIDTLDISDWQKSKLVELNLTTIGQVLSATESELKTAKFVGDVRARRMRNAAVAAVLEYLSG
jgi:hypothetical protein